MALIPKRCVTDNTTGSVLKYGRTDFSGQYNPAIETQHDLDDSAIWVPGVPPWYHKVVSALLEEMTGPEKAAVDAYREAKRIEQLRFPTVVTKIVPNLAALPVPPPRMGVIVGVQSIAGSRGFVISTGSDYLVFVSSGTYP